MKIKRLYRELVRRNVFRAVLAYLAVAWVLIEFSSVILPTFDAPPYLLQGIIYLLAIGLVFWTIFAWIYDLTPEGWKKTPDWTDTTETRAANSRRLNAVIAVSAVTAILLLLAGSFWAGSRWNSDQELAYEPAYQIAVIPIESDTTGLEEAEVFRDGLTQELIEALSGNRSLMVLNMGSTKYFTAGLVPDNTYLASNSGNIDYFVSGKLNKNENLLKVTLELRKDLLEGAIWTREYQSDLSGVKKLWASATADILDFIGLGSPETRSIEKELRSIHPETYELYLKGKYYLSKSTVEDWQRGLVYLQEAIDRNPADPDAYASMAEGYITWGHNLMPPDDVFPKALAASKRAIQLDSTNALGWATLADYHTYFGWDYAMADYAFRKADSLNPNMALNHYHRSWYLALFGRMNEAIAEHKRAQELDPFTPMHTAWMAELYRWVGEYDLALAELEKVFEMNTGRYALALVLKGMILTDMGRVDEGLETMRQACEINMGWYVFYGPYLMKYGQAEEANDLLKELEALPDIPFFNLVRAGTYKEAGDLDKAFEYLEKGKRHAWYAWFVRIYMADELQKDPRYWALLEELKLPPPGPFKYDPNV
jgi:tetratricopeptide (TPR) repeat protein